MNTIAHEYRGTFLADGMTENESTEAVEMFRAHWALAKQGKNMGAG